MKAHTDAGTHKVGALITHTHTLVHAHSYIHTHMHKHTLAHAHSHTHTHTYTHTCTHTHTLSGAGAGADHTVQVFPGVHSFKYCSKIAHPVIFPDDQVSLFSNSFHWHYREKVKLGVVGMGESCYVIGLTTLCRLPKLGIGLVVSPAGPEVVVESTHQSL